MDNEAVRTFVETTWEESILGPLADYIEIPNKSPEFDADWQANGHMARAVELIESWCRARPIKGLSVEVVSTEGRTPLIMMEVPAHPDAPPDDCVLLYGHLDKQPEMEGWAPDLGPWKAVRRDDRLYGRGGADDGYAAFASLTAIEALQRQGLPHCRAVILIEASEESGSPDLPHYIELLRPRIGTPSLIVCLDSGCGDYENLWCTTSLRGMVVGDLSVEVLREGVHSGNAGGIVPSTFRIARQLLSRIESEATGDMCLDALNAEIPAARATQAEVAAAALGAVEAGFPFLPGVAAQSPTAADLILRRTWRPALEVTGADGLPAMASAGNVARPRTALKLSIRLPPTADAQAAYAAVKKTLEADPPYGAKVRFEGAGMGGWDAPPVVSWLEAALDRAAKAHFRAKSVYMGEGGSIPFMGMLGSLFPEAQFMITGVLGPESNAHGPNEFLHIPTAKRLTAAVASVLNDHAQRGAR